MAVTCIVVMAYVQGSMALKNRPTSTESSTVAGEAAHGDGADLAKVMRRQETMQMIPLEDNHNVIRRQTDQVQTLGVDPKGSFKHMHHSLTEHTAGAAAETHPEVAASDVVATAKPPGAADHEIKKAAATQDEVILEKAAAKSIMTQQAAEASSAHPQQTEETEFAAHAAAAIAAASTGVLAEVPYMEELQLGKNVPAPTTVAVTLPAGPTQGSSKLPAAPAASPPVPEVASFNTRVHAMVQLINYPGFFGKRMPSMFIYAIMLIVASFALAGLWRANHPAPELSEWQKQHQFLVQHFQEKSGEPIKQEQDLATAVGLKSTTSKPESEEAQWQPSLVDPLKSKLHIEAN